jgi:hypothetical protein
MLRSRDSAVGIATGHGLDDGRVAVRVPVGSRIFHVVQTSSGVNPTYPGALFPGVKRPGREADHSPPASAEVKKIWIYTSIPPCPFMA